MPDRRNEAHHSCICPWWLMVLFDDRLRRLIQPTGPVLQDFVRPGYSCLDVGCGMGYFTIPMAHRVTPTGNVTGVDLQPEMLEGAARRARREGMTDRITLCLPDEAGWIVEQKYDFILAFWMLHEVREPQALLGTLRRVLKVAGSFLLVEPRLHVRAKHWDASLRLAEATGFREDCQPVVRFSRAAVLRREQGSGPASG